MTSGSIHKHKDKKMKKKKTKKKKKSGKTHSEETELNYGRSGDEMTDLGEELHPIGYYINDREEMINQMFSVIKPDKIRAMLPPILKESSIEELKAYCLEELFGMSWKRINSVLEGRECESSSESEEESLNDLVQSNKKEPKETSSSDSDKQWSESEEKCEETEPNLEGTCAAGETSAPATDVDTLEIGITNEEMGELFKCVPSSENNERKRRPDNEEASTSWSKRPKLTPNQVQFSENVKKTTEKNTESKGSDDGGRSSADENGSTAESDSEESKGKTLLDILELEMRARAIRALLKQQVGSGDGDEVPSEKNIPEQAATESQEPKEIPGSNLEKQLQSTQDCSAPSDASTKTTRKKLNRNSGKPDETSHCASNTTSLPTSESRNVDNISDTKEEKSSSSQSVNVKPELSNDEQIIPDLESTDKVEEKKIIDSKTTESDEEKILRDREDGELSSDGEKSSDSIFEIQPTGGSSDIIVLDDSEDDLIDLKKEEQSNSKNTKDIKQAKNSEKKLFPKEGSSSKRHERGKKSSGREKVSEVDKENLEKSESSCNDDTEETEPTTDKNLSKETNECVIRKDAGSEVGKNGKSECQLKKNETVPVSWAARWLQSKGVQKVVSTSKMCAKIRNRMRSAQKEKKINSETPKQEETKKESVVIVGSVNEYNMLDKPKSIQNEGSSESEEKNTDKI